MLKRIFLAALLLPLLAFGQSYPSPTFNNLTVNGTFTLSGGVPPASLATQAANTVLANVTASSASPTAVALPSCSTANSALKYTSASGFSCGTTYGLTTGTLAQFALTTSAQLLGIISDETGSGSLVFGTNPTISGATVTTGTINNTPIGATTANTGKFTTLQATSTITPSTTAGIVGTTLADSANAGSVGEVIQSTFSGVNITSSGVNQNLTSMSLTAGDWDVTCSSSFAAAATTTTGAVVAGVSTTSATLPSIGNYYQLTATYPVNATATAICPTQRINVSTTTTVYLVGLVLFGTSTESATGFLRARRVR